jgi:hypothetical protein
MIIILEPVTGHGLFRRNTNVRLASAECRTLSRPTVTEHLSMRTVRLLVGCPGLAAAALVTTSAPAAPASPRCCAVIGHVLENGPSPRQCRKRAVDWSRDGEQFHPALGQSAHGCRSGMTRQDNVQAVEEWAQRLGRMELQAFLGWNRSSL